jgi:hypothetical protein
MARSGHQFKNQSTESSTEEEADAFAMQYTADWLLPSPPVSTWTFAKQDLLHQELDSMDVDAEILPGLQLLRGGGNDRFQGGALQNC